MCLIDVINERMIVVVCYCIKDDKINDKSE